MLKGGINHFSGIISGIIIEHQFDEHLPIIPLSLWFIALAGSFLTSKVHFKNILYLISLIPFGFILSSFHSNSEKSLAEKYLGLLEWDSVEMKAEIYMKMGSSKYLLNNKKLIVEDEYLITEHLLVLAKMDQNLTEGDDIQLKGKILPKPQIRNPGQFDYASYLESLDVTAQIKVDEINLIQSAESLGFIQSIQKEVSELIFIHFSQETSGFIKAIILGDSLLIYFGDLAS